MADRIQDRADYPCRNCRGACLQTACPSWQECFRRAWRDTTDKIKEAGYDRTRKA